MVHVVLLLALCAVELALPQLCLADLVEGYRFEVGFHQLLQLGHSAVVGANVVGWVDEVHVVFAGTAALYRTIVHNLIIIISHAHLKEPPSPADIADLTSLPWSSVFPMF